MLSVGRGGGEFEADRKPRLQPAHHRQAQDKQASKPCDLRPESNCPPAASQLLERELQVDNQTQPLEAVAHGMQAKIEQFIVRGELQTRLPLELSTPRPPQSAFQ